MAWFTAISNGILSGVYSRQELLVMKLKLENGEFISYGITSAEALKLIALINKKIV